MRQVTICSCWSLPEEYRTRTKFFRALHNNVHHSHPLTLSSDVSLCYTWMVGNVLSHASVVRYRKPREFSSVAAPHPVPHLGTTSCSQDLDLSRHLRLRLAFKSRKVVDAENDAPCGEEERAGNPLVGARRGHEALPTWWCCASLAAIKGRRHYNPRKCQKKEPTNEDVGTSTSLEELKEVLDEVVANRNDVVHDLHLLPRDKARR